MSQVGKDAEELLMQLVAWELLGHKSLDPKNLLRQLEFPDLCIIHGSVRQRYTSEDILESDGFLAERMIVLEMSYRTGCISDWAVEGTNGEIKLIPIKEGK